MALSAAPILAEAQSLPFDPAPIEACLAGSEPFEACPGRAAEQCMQNSTDGQTTVGMGNCLAAEYRWWDDRLNATYARLRAAAQATDSELRELGGRAPSQADALRDMQRAWIRFRDATCAYIRSQWGGGSGGGPASVSCQLHETARQWRFLSEQDVGE